MKPLLIFCQLLTAAVSLGQNSGNPLQFRSFGISLGVGRDECLVLATKVGEVGLAGSITGNWRRVDVAKADEIVYGAYLENPCFFNKDTGFVSGSIYSKNYKDDIIYHTTDGGSKWKAIKFGQNGRVDDAVYTDSGQAWLSITGSGIAYSNDYGLTWKKCKNPDVKQRFAHIFFNTNRQGIIGSLWNLLAYTNDNCNTWKYLPTPLDQKKYDKTAKKERADINRVAIFKDYFLAAQEDLVFYSKRDSINWIWLPDYSDFYTDANNSALFFRTNKNNYVRADDNFKPVHTLEVTGTSYDARCRNGSLFVVCNNKMIQLTTGNEIVSTLFTEKNAPGNEPVSIGYQPGGNIGYMDNKIFVQKQYNGSWQYLFTFPMVLDSNHIINITKEGSLLYFHGQDSLFYFDFTGRLIKKTTKDTMVAGFVKSGIKQLVFSNGSRGCYHYQLAKLQYTNMGDEFGGAIESGGTVNGKGMPDNEDRIGVRDVADFANLIPALYNPVHATTIEDLGFSESDYKQCKKDILEFQQRLSKDNKKSREDDFTFYRNNLDFDRLLNLVDSIKYLDTNRVFAFLMGFDRFFSTTTNWKTIELVNNDNEVLSVSYTYSSFPNVFHFPWQVSLNGYSTVSIDININRFIEKVYPSFLPGSGKVKVLHELVKRLY
ncbi:WD40/YVTN/BNR-like repeat-containing protein [Niastella sp. OAS944]|uniref:WD40/YVTN/BNR-like repeat-containing protein n=1 Tax=Niastella sp. OAS944 TaxID=2664089 RepID=UPI00348981FE|nr:hypothetical protein [Chitinophagaceae bacterium OAS944]